MEVLHIALATHVREKTHRLIRRIDLQPTRKGGVVMVEACVVVQGVHFLQTHCQDISP